MADYYCIKECNTYNKRFKVGDMFPAKWIAEGYLPNHHFSKFDGPKEALSFAKERNANRPIQCAGDDPRSTKDLKAELQKHVKSFPEKWGRKEIWLELNRHENAKGKTA